jgi:L-ascorbate metabolism protein UlaG (beta-lactamase superfamily)
MNVPRRRRSAYYHGPRSDHFDGERFFLDEHMEPKRVVDVLRWWMTGRKGAWPASVPNGRADQPPERIEGSGLRIAFVGHASLLIQTGGLNFLLDPVWSARASPVRFAGPKRVNAPGVAFEALPSIDAVLVSHCHYDHLDVRTLSSLAARDCPRVITPLGNDTIMRRHDRAIRAESYDWGNRVQLGSHCAVTLAPMRHWSARHLLDRNKALWAAFVIETQAGRIYHVGDSGYGDGRHFRNARNRYGPFLLAILPIGAYEPRSFMRDQHMNPQEAVRAYLDSGAELALAHHHSTFHLTDEPIDAPVNALVRALQEAGVASERFRVLRPGEVLEFAAESAAARRLPKCDGVTGISISARASPSR